MSHLWLTVLLAVTGLISFNGMADEPLAAPAVESPQDAERAKALLQRAVALYKAQGDEAFAAFSRQGEFIDHELYVYVLDDQSVMLASGGPSVVMIGRPMMSLLDPELKQAFTQIVSQPETGHLQEIEYRWKNPADGQVERKHTYYQRIGNRFLAVGYYRTRAEPEAARRLLTQAVEAVQSDPTGTFRRINDLDKPFLQDDLYVFVVDWESQHYVAHGYDLRRVGSDFSAVKDPDGKPIGQDMLALAGKQPEGEYAYKWRNPITHKIENKHAYFKREGKYLVVVGYYTTASQE
jgi:cytochrome c